jgi:hypothetical protein
MGELRLSHAKNAGGNARGKANWCGDRRDGRSSAKHQGKPRGKSPIVFVPEESHVRQPFR